MRDTDYFVRVTSFAIIMGVMIAFMISQPLLNAFAQESGSLKVTVNHADGTPANPEDFFANLDGSEKQGYFSLNDDEGNIVDVLPTCNESSGSCDIGGLGAGSYTATITLGGGALTVGGVPAEYSEDIIIEEGVLTEVTITVDYGQASVRITHLDGQELDPTEFISEFGSVEGYYSIYDSEGDFVVDAPSCNLDDEPCAMVLATGIYSATVASPASMIPYTVVFEVVDNAVIDETIKVQIGAFEVRVIDKDGEEADPSSFSHPIGYNELGRFAAYDADGYLITEGDSCNLSDNCTYPLDAGVYKISIRRLPAHLILSCIFEVADNSLTPVKLYLDPPGCNQLPVDSDSENGDGNDGTSGGTNSGSSGSNNAPVGGNNTGSSGAKIQELPTFAIKSEDEPVGILTHRSYIDNEDGFYHVIGEVQNQGKNFARDVLVYGIFSDGREIISIKRGYSIQELLEPNQKSPFEIVIRDSSIAEKITNYTLAAPSSQTATNGKQQYLGLNITRQYYENITGLYHVNGLVTSYADNTANFVKVTVSLYDHNNNLIYVASKYIVSELDHGRPSAFDISFTPINATQIARVAGIVESDEYTMVKTGFLRSPIQLTLDSSTYQNGAVITADGTVGNSLSQEKFAIVEIIWPDGIRYDRELVRVSPDGSYQGNIRFFTLPEFEQQTFTVRVSYGNFYAQEEFIFVH